MSDFQPVVIRLPREMHTKFRQVAKEADLSMSQYIRKLLREEFERNEQTRQSV